MTSKIRIISKNLTMIKKNSDKWIASAKQNRRSIFFYQNKVLDLTEFSSEHPGGKKALDNYLYKDITQILFKVYPHQRQATLDKLSRYLIGMTTDEQGKVRKPDRSMSKNSDKSQKQKKKVCFKKKDTNKSVQSHKSIQLNIKEKQVSKGKQKKNNKNSKKDINSKNKENKKVKKEYQVSIKCIQTSFNSGFQIEENHHQVKKQQQYEVQWETNILPEDLLQNKEQIYFPSFVTKSKVSL